MANNKTGFDYYNVDTDRYQDIRIKRLKKDCGPAGIAVYDYILCEIYRVRGCFLEWDENTAFDVAEYFGLKESRVNDIVSYCAAVGLFDIEVLRCESVLTSRSIQQRFTDMSVRAKRKNFKIPDRINKLTEESPKLTEESPKLTEVCRKVKESKVNISLSNAHVHEELFNGNILDKPLMECYDELKSNQSWIEIVVMNTRSFGFKEFTIESFQEHLKNFFAELQNEGEQVKSPKDAMSHFARWLKIELKKQEYDRRRTKSFSKTSRNPAGKVVCSKADENTNRVSCGESQKDYSARF